MDTSDEEDEIFEPLENYDPNLPSSFNDNMEMEAEMDFDATLPSNLKIKKDLDLDSPDQE